MRQTQVTLFGVAEALGALEHPADHGTNVISNFVERFILWIIQILLGMGMIEPCLRFLRFRKGLCELPNECPASGPSVRDLGVHGPRGAPDLRSKTVSLFLWPLKGLL